MDMRPLGRTGVSVSAIGLGTVKFGRNQGLKYPAAFALPAPRTLADLLAIAHDLGINLIDTAPAYGDSESRLGTLLRGQRDDWLLATKVGESFSRGRSSFDFSARATRESVERSLRRLGTDRLDLVLVHSDGRDEHILAQEEVVDELRRLRDRGLVRWLGLSGKTVAGGLAAVAELDVVMVTYNALDAGQAPVIDAARGAGVGVLVKKGLVSGHLDALHGHDPVGEAMRFVLGNPGVSSLVVGTINADHLRANVDAAARVVAG